MSKTSLTQSKKIYDYLETICVHESETLKSLRQKTSEFEESVMQITPLQGQFLKFLIQLTDAKNILEIGVFTGYSTLCIAEASGENATITACDISKKWTDIAQTFWQQAQLQNKIHLILNDANQTLSVLAEKNHSKPFDFIFIDADKKSYLNYYELSLKLLRPRGLMVIDNILWSGNVLDETIQDTETVSIRNLNKRLSTDKRIQLSSLPLSDGLTLVIKQ